MLKKITLVPNENLHPVEVEWKDEESDYIITCIPQGLSRTKLIELVDEIERITDWEDYI